MSIKCFLFAENVLLKPQAARNALFLTCCNLEFAEIGFIYSRINLGASGGGERGGGGGVNLLNTQYLDFSLRSLLVLQSELWSLLQ